MDALLSLTVANLRSFTRDRAALFWTIAFPVIFIVLFGTLFSGGGTPDYKVGWVDQDGIAGLGAAPPGVRGRVSMLTLTTTDQDAGLASTRDGKLDATDRRARKGFGAGVAAATGPARRADRASQIASRSTRIRATRPPRRPQPDRGGRDHRREPGAVGPSARAERSRRSRSRARPSSTGRPTSSRPSSRWRIMQLGIFAAIPLVQQREKLILKRIGATPLPRWTLVGSNVLLRLVIAAGQTVIILAIGIGAVQGRDHGQLAGDRRLRRAGIAGVHRPRLRDRLVRPNRGGRQRRSPRSSRCR